MKEFFEPKSVALIGASEHAEKVGGVLFQNLSKSNIKFHPVNPNHKEIEGKKCYSSILDIKESIELVIIAIKAEFVAESLEECGKKGIKNAIIISAGFGESGNRQGELIINEIAKQYKMNILGPNVLGFINNKINASFFDGFPENGKIAILSQSGALGVAMLDYSIKNKIGLSKFISLGNMIDIDFNKTLEYIISDKETEIICLDRKSVV
jgi:acetyltransferase